MNKVCKMKTIQYEKELVKFDGLPEAVGVYYFYIDGLWDEDKLLYNEALVKYPPKEYNWELVEGGQ